MATFRSLAATPPTSLSPIRMTPAVGRSNPAIIRSVVLFPQPLGPTRTKNSCSFTSKSKPSTARTPRAKTLDTPSRITRAMSRPAARDSSVRQHLPASLRPNSGECSKTVSNSTLSAYWNLARISALKEGVNPVPGSASPRWCKIRAIPSVPSCRPTMRWRRVTRPHWHFRALAGSGRSRKTSIFTNGTAVWRLQGCRRRLFVTRRCCVGIGRTKGGKNQIAR